MKLLCNEERLLDSHTIESELIAHLNHEKTNDDYFNNNKKKMPQEIWDGVDDYMTLARML